MATLPRHPQRVHPSYPKVDHEGTVIDYRDDPTAWTKEPRYATMARRQARDFQSGDDSPDAFLDHGSAFRRSPRYDAVFERAIPPNRAVKLISLDGSSPVVIGVFATLQDANDAAFRVGTMLFAVRAV